MKKSTSLLALLLTLAFCLGAFQPAALAAEKKVKLIIPGCGA
ncbi:hypothetical protein QUF80_10260 [Desulfococcaceae bacterium HSG8]|nr:hypothetical protein [Desulfococcaceae bacterium HSG8]